MRIRKILAMSSRSSTVLSLSCLLVCIFSCLMAGCSESGGDTPSTTVNTSPTLGFGSPSRGQIPVSSPGEGAGGEGASDVSQLGVAEPDAESEWVDAGQTTPSDEESSDGGVSEAALEEIDSLDVAIGVDDASGDAKDPVEVEEEGDSEALSCLPDETLCSLSGECCAFGESCFSYGCVVTGNDCTDSSQCSDDMYCEPEAGACIPWGQGPKGLSEPGCSKTPVPGVFFPQLQCEWTGPPEGDAFPNHRNVLGSIIAVSFTNQESNGSGGANVSASQSVQLAFVSYEGTDGGLPSASCCGVIRVIDGKTCQQLFSLDEHKVVGGGNLAAGDLNGDGIAEIVALAEGGGLVAFSLSEDSLSFELLWHSTLPDGSLDTYPGASVYQWNGPGIADVTGDERPEIVMDGALYDADGVQLTQSVGWSNYQQGVFPVVGDADLDGEPEVFFGSRAYRVAEGGLSFEPAAFQPPDTFILNLGHIALANFGAYPGLLGTLPELAAEIVMVSAGSVYLYDLTGQLLWGPVSLPGGGTGGPPTVADFDGDGFPEIAAAGALAYTVFDLECSGDPLPDKCASEHVLWSQPSQDGSSNKTGSSVFDFEGDGQAEAVYGDECFLRVYNGATGDVIFSGPRSSCTWHEMPIIADLDGDYRTEMAIGSNLNCNVGCPELDPIFAGLRCDSGDQCGSGQCVEGLCRCASDEECLVGTLCAQMLEDDGNGNVCRAAHTGKKQGVQVFADSKDSWVYSRPIWNQHAYNVTNVNDDGTIPPRQEVVPNWAEEDLNHFRQNAQGSSSPVLAADLTIEFVEPIVCADGELSWVIEVCNRGALPVGAGVELEVKSGDSVVVSTTTEDLFPGLCSVWEGTMPVPENWPGSLVASVDRKNGGEVFECVEGNNGTSAQFPVCDL